MIGTLNALVDLVEQCTDDEIDVTAFAREHGTTEHHLRRMFSSLAGMPLSEYVRRRRMTLAAALWAATATEWFPSNPWRLRPGPSIVRYLEFTGTHASCELWLPVEPA